MNMHATKASKHERMFLVWLWMLFTNLLDWSGTYSLPSVRRTSFHIAWIRSPDLRCNQLQFRKPPTQLPTPNDKLKHIFHNLNWIEQITFVVNRAKTSRISNVSPDFAYCSMCCSSGAPHSTIVSNINFSFSDENAGVNFDRFRFHFSSFWRSKLFAIGSSSSQAYIPLWPTSRFKKCNFNNVY